MVKTPEDYRKKYPGGIMSKKAVQKPAASPTCCQPARPSGVTVPDELPEEPAVEVAEPIEVAFEKAEKATQKIGQALVNLAQQIGPPDDEPLLISGVMSRVLRNNKYELMRTGSGHLTIVLSGRDDHFNQENILILTPNQWRDLSREINVMLKQLEVKE